ncbi:unnamed protein product, partial [Owenia fusiformis]
MFFKGRSIRAVVGIRVLFTITVISQQVYAASPKSVPNKPRAIGAKAITSSTTITLSVFDEEDAVTHYRAVHIIDQNTVNYETIFPRTVGYTYKNINDLIPSRFYTFCVYSVIRTAELDRNSTNCTNSTPVIETGPGPISNFWISDETETSLVVKWEELKRPATKLSVSYQQYEANPTPLAIDVTNSLDNKINLTGLRAGARYTVRIEVTYVNYSVVESSPIKDAITKPYPPRDVK